MGKIRTAYLAGKICDVDRNFFYDYVALLGTMQNQPFFSAQQTDKMLSWMQEAIEEPNTKRKPAPVAPPAPAEPSRAEKTRLQNLQEQNKRLREESEKLRVVSDAIVEFKSFVPPSAAEPEEKTKSKKKRG